MDLATINEWTLRPGESKDLPTGLRVELPEGVWGRITGRSSTLRKRGLFVNEGVIDQGYRGELFVYVTNRNDYDTVIEHGTRLAQLILAPVLRAAVVEVERVSDSIRGSKGFGSTGHHEWTRVEAILDKAALEASQQDTQGMRAALPPAGVFPVASVWLAGVPVEYQTPTDAVVVMDGQERPSSGLPVASASVYLGGPIDYVATSPEDRHRRFIVACQMTGPKTFFDVYCPACRKKADETPGEAIERNQAEVSARDWGVFEWNPDVKSFGTPVEIWTRAMAGQPSIIVGTLGTGLFAQFLRTLRWSRMAPERAAVVEVASMRQAVEFILHGHEG